VNLVYIAGPYTSDPGLNTLRAIQAGNQCMDVGLWPFIPHLSHYPHTLVRERPYEDWMALDLAWLAKADILWRIPGDSPGADREVAEAHRLGIPVVYSFEHLCRYVLDWYRTRVKDQVETIEWLKARHDKDTDALATMMEGERKGGKVLVDFADDDAATAKALEAL
jgi:hypothetical protein